VNGRVHSKGFPNDGVQNGQILHFFIFHGAELALLTKTKKLDLLIVNSLTVMITV
jgi:hypothetical protein